MKPCNTEGNPILTTPSRVWTSPIKEEKETGKKIERPFSIEPEEH